MFSLPNLPLPVAYEAYADLCRLMPEYPDDTAHSLAHRAAVAMAGVADLYPADAFQARLAAKAIAADLHATDCLAMAKLHKADFEKKNRSLAQAASMMRQTQRFYRILLDCQKLRRQPGASAGARIIEAYLRDCAGHDDPRPAPDRAAEPAGGRVETQADLAVAASACVPPAAGAAPADTAGTAEPPALIPAAQAELPAESAPPADTQAEPAPAPEPQQQPAGAAPEPQHEPAAASAEPLRLVATAPQPAVAPAAQPDPLEQAEEYAIQYGLFAAMIRADGGISPRVRAKVPQSQMPAGPVVIEALVHGHSMLLDVLDEMKPTLDELVPMLRDAKPELLAA